MARRCPSRASRTHIARVAPWSPSTRSANGCVTAPTSSSSRSPERFMSVEILDDFRDVSGLAQLALHRDTGPGGGALRLDYDFKGGGGFVVARKLFARRMPESWAIEVQVRGAAPANKLEIKLVDPNGRDVWWWRRDAFEFPDAWQPLHIRSSEVSFAWGPAGGRAMSELGAIEIAIAAGPGGRGTVSFADLRFEDLSLSGPPAWRRRAPRLVTRRPESSTSQRPRAGVARPLRRRSGSPSTSVA